jgi:hypothetical protein
VEHAQFGYERALAIGVTRGAAPVGQFCAHQGMVLRSPAAAPIGGSASVLVVTLCNEDCGTAPPLPVNLAELIMRVDIAPQRTALNAA